MPEKVVAERSVADRVELELKVFDADFSSFVSLKRRTLDREDSCEVWEAGSGSSPLNCRANGVDSFGTNAQRRPKITIRPSVGAIEDPSRMMSSGAMFSSFDAVKLGSPAITFRVVGSAAVVIAHRLNMQTN